MRHSTEARTKGEIRWQEQNKAAKPQLAQTKQSTVLIFTQKSVLWAAKKVRRVASMLTANLLVLLLQRVAELVAVPKKQPNRS